MPQGTRTRILIVDDSAVMRSLLRSVLSTDPLMEVAGTAVDGGAAGAGLPFAAVVTNVDDQVIDSADALGAVVLAHPPADTVSVSLIALQATPVLPMSRWARMAQIGHRDDRTHSGCR